MLSLLEKAQNIIYVSIVKSREVYNFSSKKLDSSLRIFYCVSLGLMIHRFSRRVAFPLDLERFEWSWPVRWMDYFEEKSFVLLAVFFLTFLLCVLCVFFIRTVWIKAFCAFGFFILSSIEFSVIGKGVSFGYNLNSWMFLFVIFSFIGNDKRKDKFLFHTAQFWFLMTYGLSGAHKLAALFHGVVQFGLSDLKPLEKSMALRLYDFPNHTIIKTILQEVMSWPSAFSLLLWGLVIYFQISCFFVAFRPPLYRLWGIFVVLFHLAVFFMLNKMFFYNIILTAFLLVETPYEIEFSLKKALVNIPGVQFLVSLISYLKKLLFNRL